MKGHLAKEHMSLAAESAWEEDWVRKLTSLCQNNLDFILWVRVEFAIVSKDEEYTSAEA